MWTPTGQKQMPRVGLGLVPHSAQYSSNEIMYPSATITLRGVSFERAISPFLGANSYASFKIQPKYPFFCKVFSRQYSHFPKPLILLFYIIYSVVVK
jgi:hypothetical protein